jgi:hypothetical protein
VANEIADRLLFSVVGEARFPRDVVEASAERDDG